MLLASVHKIDPAHEGLRALSARLDPGASAAMERGWLGSNRRQRARVERSFAARAAWYVPDRLLDLLDVISFDAHTGYGLFVDAHVTRAAQLAGGFRSVAGVGLHEHRSLGGRAQVEAGLNVLPLGAQTFTGGLAGTSGAIGIADHFAGLHRPHARLYADYRDYWAVGAAGTLLFVGVDWDVHPVQLVDFFAGFACIDFLHDDFARTRGLELSRREQWIVADLGRLRGDERALARYRAGRDEVPEASASDLAGSAPEPASPPAP